MISICIGAVRMRTAENWTAARDMLRRDINDFYPRFGNPHAQRMKDAELAQLNKALDGGWLVTSGIGASFNALRYAREGEHGLIPGQLAIIRDYSNGSRYAWTVDVKCKLTAVNPDTHKATVTITGNSVQFTRWESITVPSSFLRFREK